jgi:hypothetical protein
VACSTGRSTEGEEHTQVDGALFERVGPSFVPSSLTVGPWRPDAMHGGPPSALVGTLISEVTEAGEHVVRVNIDLERPVLVAPLTARVVRRTVSRRVAKVEVELFAGEALVVSARALLLRGEPVVPARAPGDDGDPPRLAGEEHRVELGPGAHAEPVVYHRDGVEARVLEGGFDVSGPSVAWMRLLGPVIAGEPPFGLAQVLAVADFGSALSQSVDPDSDTGLINLDVNVSLTREPVGPWFRIAATGRLGAEGIGLAVAELTDEHGPLGLVTQSQIVHAWSRPS